jgi:hypothetical protein
VYIDGGDDYVRIGGNPGTFTEISLDIDSGEIYVFDQEGRPKAISCVSTDIPTNQRRNAVT